MLEGDDIFHTGTINPTMPPNYIDNVWKDLSIKFGDGPEFKLLKSGRRDSLIGSRQKKTKYGKVIRHRNGSGDGEAIKIHTTDLEGRAIAAWGKIFLNEMTVMITLYPAIFIFYCIKCFILI